MATWQVAQLRADLDLNGAGFKNALNALHTILKSFDKDLQATVGRVRQYGKALDQSFGDGSKRVRDLNSALGNLSKENKKAVDGIKETTKESIKFSDALKVLSVAAAAYKIGQVIGSGIHLAVDAFKDAVKASIELESRLATLRKTTGLTAGQVDVLKNEIFELGTVMAGIKVDELIDIANMGGRLGIASGDIKNFTRDVALMKIALDDIPAEELATSTSRILNVFRVGTGAAMSFGSALNRLDDTSTATGRDLLDVARRLSGPASTLGISIPKLLALSTALKDAGVANEVAGTSITQLLIKMSTETQKFAQIAEYSFEDFADLLRRNPVKALQEFYRGLNQLEPQDKINVLADLNFKGQRTIATFLQLGQTIGRLPAYIRTAEKEWSTHASILRENQIRGETTAAQLEVLQNRLLKLKTTIGNYMLPIVKALSKSFGELSEDVVAFLESHRGGIQDFANNIKWAADKVGLLIRNFKDFKEIGKSIGLEKLQQTIDILGRVGSDIGRNISTAIGNTMTVLKNLFNGLAAFLGDLFDQVGKNIAANLQNAILSLVGSYFKQKMTEAIKQALPGIGGELAAKLFGIKFDAEQVQVPVPKIKPDTDLMGDPFKGTKQLPGMFQTKMTFNEEFRNKQLSQIDDPILRAQMEEAYMLRNRAAERKKPWQNIEEAEDKREWEMIRRRNAVMEPHKPTAKETLNERRKAEGLPEFEGDEKAARAALRGRSKLQGRIKRGVARTRAKKQRRVLDITNNMPAHERTARVISDMSTIPALMAGGAGFHMLGNAGVARHTADAYVAAQRAHREQQAAEAKRKREEIDRQRREKARGNQGASNAPTMNAVGQLGTTIAQTSQQVQALAQLVKNVKLQVGKTQHSVTETLQTRGRA